MIFLLVSFCLLSGFFCFFVKMVYFVDYMLRQIELEFQKV